MGCTVGEPLPVPSETSGWLMPDFAAGYIGFYVCNGAVILQEFGDTQADTAARQALQRVFPEREVVQLNVDGIAAGGGSIHCTTQQQALAGQTNSGDYKLYLSMLARQVAQR